MIWLHYVGGFYTQEKFVAEARRAGVSRRVAPNVAKFMRYGDTVQLLNWNNGKPLHFADFVTGGISMDAEISEELAPKLIEEGKAHLVSTGGDTVVRECGSYVASASYEVDTELGEVVEKANEIAARLQIKPKYMITGRLSHVYDPPVEPDPSPKFFRGFVNMGAGRANEHGQLVQGVIGYSKRTRKKREDLQR
jgi:hypothetical protein